jgi:ribosomal protein S6--L-glutamate ligase
MPPRIISCNQKLAEYYEGLNAGDIINGRVRLRPGEEHVLLDLVSRGIILIPSALAQILSRSKAAQSRLLASFMLPNTCVIYDRHDMMRAVTDYGRHHIGQVVVKLDRANGGQGILLFDSVEQVNNQTVLGSLGFPFVLQPYQNNFTDIRVVILDEIVDSYCRINPDNFRRNLHCGGNSNPWPLTEQQLQFCRGVMARGDFLYAHLDLMIFEDNSIFLTEINLRGGLHGSTLNQNMYHQQVANIHQRQLDSFRRST